MSRMILQLPPDEDGHAIGRVEVDGFDGGGAIYLEVIDESVFSGKPVSACVMLTREQAEGIAQALIEATT